MDPTSDPTWKAPMTVFNFRMSITIKVSDGVEVAINRLSCSHRLIGILDDSFY